MPSDSILGLRLDETTVRSVEIAKQEKKMDINDQDMIKTILNLDASDSQNILQSSFCDTGQQNMSSNNETASVKQASVMSIADSDNCVFSEVPMPTSFLPGHDSSLNGGLPHDLHNVKVHDFSEVKPVIHNEINNQQTFPPVSPEQCFDLKFSFQSENVKNNQSQMFNESVDNQSHVFSDAHSPVFNDGRVNQSHMFSDGNQGQSQVFTESVNHQTSIFADTAGGQSQVLNDAVGNQPQMFNDGVGNQTRLFTDNAITSNQSPTQTFNENPVFSSATSLNPEPLSTQQVLNTNISPSYNTSTEEKLYGNIVDIKSGDNQFDLPLSAKLPTFTALAANAQNTNSTQGTFLQPQSEQKSVLEELLTKKTLSPLDDLNVSSPSSISSPDYRDESPSSMSSPNSAVVVVDTGTQSTLITKSERLHLDSETSPEDVQILDQVNWNLLNENEPSKVLKSRRHSDAPSAAKENEPELVEKLFDAGIATSSTSEFIFSKFGSDLPNGLFTFGESDKATKQATEYASTSVLQTVTSVQPDFEKSELKPQVQVPVTRSQTHSRRSKEPVLNQQFPSKLQGIELRILDQPEEQHRARYLTEGSRGAVKNRSQDGHPLIKLFGFEGPAILQVFVGNDTGRVKPHGFYQACKVAGKNSTPCREMEIDGTVVIEMDLNPVSDMTASIDNVGILKLRNADVEQRIGLAKAKKKSTKARMIFRVMFSKEDGTSQTLQIASCSILCTQPIGQPEACKLSCFESTAEGGNELFIIGKNFMKGTKVLFQEIKTEDSSSGWEHEAEIDKDYFQPTHLICKVPAYHDVTITKPVKIQIVVSCAGKTSDPQYFTYTPVGPSIKQETPMETDQCQKRNIPFTVSPEALELNKQIQESQQTAPTSMFQLPPGTIPMSERSSMNVDNVVVSSVGSSQLPPSINVSQATSFPAQTRTDTDHHMESIQSLLQSDLQKAMEQVAQQQFLNQTANLVQNQPQQQHIIHLQQQQQQQQQEHQQQQRHEQQQLQQHQQLQQQHEHQHQQQLQQHEHQQQQLQQQLQQQHEHQQQQQPQKQHEHQQQQPVPQTSTFEHIIQHHNVQHEMMDQGVVHTPVTRIENSSAGLHINALLNSTGNISQNSRPVINFQTLTNDSGLQGVPRLATSVNASVPSQQLSAPQIIICGNNGVNSSSLAGLLGQPPVQLNPQTQLPHMNQQPQQQPQITTTAPAQTAPSIVILQGGSNASSQGNDNSQNEVENLLRSILGGWQQQS